MDIDKLIKGIEMLPDVSNYEQCKKDKSMIASEKTASEKTASEKTVSEKTVSEKNEQKQQKRTSFKEWYMNFDNDITFVVGYRNLFNIGVMFVSAWYMSVASNFDESSVIYIGALIMLVMGMKWFLIQARSNIDELYVITTIGECDECDDECNKPGCENKKLV